MFYQFKSTDIKGVDVFLEKFKTRLYVGRLIQDLNTFIFEYQDDYLKQKNIIPLGVEFPLTKKRFESTTLFESFKDRLPDVDNPAYKDYCAVAGIEEYQSNPIILLATIGKKGPSSFIFEPYFEYIFTFDVCEMWRKELGFSIQDFARFFGISISILQKIKAGKSNGKEVLSHLELCWRFKNVFKFQLETHGKWLHRDKIRKALHWYNNKN